MKVRQKKWIVFLTVAALFMSCNKEKTEQNENVNGNSGNTPEGYVDLGLPSGTLWKTTNETNPYAGYDVYTWIDAMITFGNQIPSSEHFSELFTYCEESWDADRKVVVYKSKINGNTLCFPAPGGRGEYWSSTNNGLFYCPQSESSGGYIAGLHIYPHDENYPLEGDNMVITFSGYLPSECFVRTVKYSLPNYTIDPDPDKYIDLGLTSGTYWKNSDENGLYDHVSAINAFGDYVPSYRKCKELVSECKHFWDDTKNGCVLVGPNGNAIFLPATANRYYKSYWASSSKDSEAPGPACLYFQWGNITSDCWAFDTCNKAIRLAY